MIGPPQPEARAVAVRGAPPRRVLFFSTNGVGMGHLTRLLAIAKRCPPPIQPVFVTMSQAMRVLREQGYLAEYLPFHAYLGADETAWNVALEHELREKLSFYDPRVVVFDGNIPYAGLVAALSHHPDCVGIWSRRAMWRPNGLHGHALECEASFDVVLEPGEIAAAFDDGPTVANRGRTRLVAPIRLLDADDMPDRDEARRELGLDLQRPAVLLALGAGNNFNTDAIHRRTVAYLVRRHNVQVACVEWPMADRTPDLPDGVLRLRRYPLGRWLRAFDAAVSAAGYNSFHELLFAGIPTVWVPNEHPQQDAQITRARYAEWHGLGFCVRAGEIYRLHQALDRILDPQEQAAIRARCVVLDRANGAAEAARMVEEFALTCRADRSGPPRRGRETQAVPGSAGENQRKSWRERARQRQSRHIKFLKARLELGFEAEALDELRRYLDSPIEPTVRREAAWMMALWLLDRDDEFESAVAAHEYLSLLGSLSPNWSKRTDYSILLVESLIRLGRISDARAACLSAWERHESPDLALAMSNVLLAQDPERYTQTADALRLLWINRVFKNRPGFILSKRDQSRPLSIDNLTVDAPPLDGDWPLISVIMPAYNAEEYIATAIESVLNQTWRNLELIIVDDASSDNTPEVIRAVAMKDPRIRVLANQRNMQAGFSRSLALREAAGHLVTCQDADDWGHPRKIEIQALHLLSNSSAAANISEHVRTSTELGFTRRGRPGFYIAPYISSLMFRREEVLQTVGFWDDVRLAEDAEYFKRVEAHFGRDRVARLKTGPMLFARVHDQQQTGSAVTGYKGYNYGARAEYAQAYEAWHRKARDGQRGLYVSFPQAKRPFPAPLVMISAPEEQPHRLDVVIASDFRLHGGSTNSSAEEIKAQRALGLRTGLMHIPRYDHNPSRPIADPIRDLVDGETVHLLVHGDRILSDLVIFRWPPALAHVPAFLPDVKARNLRIILNQTPQRRRGDDRVFYDVEAVDRNVAALFGRKGVWAPIGPEARAVLGPYADRIEVSGDDWVNILDLGDARFRPDRPENPKPVIGRHARDHPDKWPGTVEELLSAYPDSPDVIVSILGGAEVPRAMLGVLPRNWTVAPFDSMHPYEFLRTLDVFVYYPHSAWIEAFGRVILEAMAVGVPVLLPESFRGTFGGAASYAPISDVEQAVWKILQDDRLYAEQARRGREFVERGFGHDAHIRRIAGMVARRKESALHVGG